MITWEENSDFYMCKKVLKVEFNDERIPTAAGNNKDNNIICVVASRQRPSPSDYLYYRVVFYSIFDTCKVHQFPKC